MELLVVLYFQNYVTKDNETKTLVCFGVPEEYNGKGEKGIKPKYQSVFNGTLIFDLFDRVYKCKTRTFNDKTFVVEVLD